MARDAMRREVLHSLRNDGGECIRGGNNGVAIIVPTADDGVGNGRCRAAMRSLQADGAPTPLTCIAHSKPHALNSHALLSRYYVGLLVLLHSLAHSGGRRGDGIVPHVSALAFRKPKLRNRVHYYHYQL
mgnify:CR=1 FL=1